MVGENGWLGFGDSIGMRQEQIQKAYALAWEAHKSPKKHFLVEKIHRRSTSEVIISFPGSGDFKEWFSGRPFGETKINLELFPLLKSVGNNEAAFVNEAFQQRFEAILDKSTLAAKVDKALTKQKQIVFTGHSSGAAVAILATLWALHKNHTPKFKEGIPPLCVTFGSPLIATVTSHAACKLMQSTVAMPETMANFLSLSPYRPFGTHIFCIENGKLIVVRNPDAVLQVMFFSAQLSTEAEAAEIAYRSLREHTIYGTLKMQNLVCLHHFQKLPFSDEGSNADIARINMALDDLGLSTRARLCLQAAAELEEWRCQNEERMRKNKAFIEEKMKELEGYREKWEHEKVGYYDAFKLQEDPEDFQANVKRLELAGVFDQIIGMLRGHELPEEFEGKLEWVEIGTRFRRLVEPLDIANYYRHLRHNEAGPYMEKGRPNRYRYTQRWLEHAMRKPEETISESSFWAEVEDLCNCHNISFKHVKERVVRLESKIKTWIENGELSKENVFLKHSTFVMWWETLPDEHKQQSCIRSHINV